MVGLALARDRKIAAACMRELPNDVTIGHFLSPFGLSPMIRTLCVKERPFAERKATLVEAGRLRKDKNMIDFSSDELRRNPFPVYDVIRTRSPVLPVPPPFDAWMIFDFENVKR